MVGPSLFALIKAGPIGLIRRAVFKTLIGPWLYGQRDRFDSSRYWADRFRKYGAGSRGSGFEGLSDRENAEMKAGTGEELLALCRQWGIDPARDAILDIGCGGGHITKRFRDAQARHYTGLDIVDTLFPALRADNPGSLFVKTDIAKEAITGRYRMAFMIDVIQSIVTPESLGFAMENIAACLEDGGIFIVAPLFDSTRLVHFYASHWAKEAVLAHFPGFTLLETRPFRDLKMYVLRKPAALARERPPHGIVQPG